MADESLSITACASFLGRTSFGDMTSGEEGPELPGRKMGGTWAGRIGGGVARIRSSMSRRLSSSAIHSSSSSSSSSPTGAASIGGCIVRHAWISGPAGGDESRVEANPRLLFALQSSEKKDGAEEVDMLPSFEKAMHCQSGASTVLDGEKRVRKRYLASLDPSCIRMCSPVFSQPLPPPLSIINDPYHGPAPIHNEMSRGQRGQPRPATLIARRTNSLAPCHGC